MENLIPLQSRKELDSMIKNSTRDLKLLKDFIQREKNPAIKKQLEGILVSSWALARKYDGCLRSVLRTDEFRKECREVFLLIIAQKRGGRKLFINTTSSPVSGLDVVHFTWWSTVRAYQGATLRYMDDFVDNLSKSDNNLSDSAISAGISSEESLNMNDPEWCNQRLLKDVAGVIREKIDLTGALSGFGIRSSYQKNELLLTITLIPRDMSDQESGDSDVDDKKPKKEIPFQSIIPKSESSRQKCEVKADATAPIQEPESPVPMDMDDDGFWTRYDPVEDQDTPNTAVIPNKEKATLDKTETKTPIGFVESWLPTPTAVTTRQQGNIMTNLLILFK